MSKQLVFKCPLPNGFHARPATILSEIANQFNSNIILTNERTGSTANAKSVLSIVGSGIRFEDSVRLLIDGEDETVASDSLFHFVDANLASCDESAPEEPQAKSAALPRMLRSEDGLYYAGTPVSAGCGRGKAIFVLQQKTGADVVEELVSAETAKQKIADAIASVEASLRKAIENPELSKVERDITSAHCAIISDPTFFEKINSFISGPAVSPKTAVLKGADHFINELKESGNAYFQERVVDIQDLRDQILAQLDGKPLGDQKTVLTEPSIIVADVLTPRQFLSYDRKYLKGLALAEMGAASHTVILARSFGIPAVSGASEILNDTTHSSEILVDGDRGLFFPKITKVVDRFYKLEEAKAKRAYALAAESVDQKAQTSDGKRLEIAANISSVGEAERAFALGAEGIGLFRTEALFMDRADAPTEEQHFEQYCSLLKMAGDKPVIIRTLDIGGDKPVPYLNLPLEENPFLGCRGLRIYKDKYDIFIQQLRALVRASAFGHLKVMAPMVSTIEEAEWFRDQIRAVQSELRAQNIAFDEKMPIGIMVEVPAIAFVVDQLAGIVDFLSVGTNDLSQYTFAADRGNGSVSHLSAPLSPAFIRLLKMISETGHASGIWVGMCGEMARDKATLPILIGLGFDEISVSAPAVAGLKSKITQLETHSCHELAQLVSQCKSVADVSNELSKFSESRGDIPIIARELIIMDSVAETKEELIKEMIDTLDLAGRLSDSSEIEDAIWAREEVYSTGLGHGFAIPHCKSGAVKHNSVTVAQLKQPLAWGSLDGEPVQVAIMLTMQNSKENMHLKVFSRLARKLMHENFRETIIREHNPDALVTYLTEELTD
jgi:fructose-specific PTS system IIA-like component